MNTAWMDSLDPLYGKIADEWMKTVVADFGTDHWYQLDGYFNGGTAPWMEERYAATLTRNGKLISEFPDEPLVGAGFKDFPTNPEWYKRGAEAFGMQISQCHVSCSQRSSH